MNLVAHQYLSFNQPDIQIGNYLGEVVKGNKYLNYPQSISKGILLHRAIDHFTDENEIVKKSTSYFHATQHKYAPIIIDLMYDYFLIKHWNLFCDIPFEKFKQDCYTIFNNSYSTYPTSLQEMTNHLIQYDWFENYKTLEGIQRTLNGISKRTKFSNNLNHSLKSMIEYQDYIEEHFLLFMPRVIKMSKEFVDES
jgi:acyl carrier protein phosphodiesterase